MGGALVVRTNGITREGLLDYIIDGIKKVPNGIELFQYECYLYVQELTWREESLISQGLTLLFQQQPELKDELLNLALKVPEFDIEGIYDV